MDRLIDRQTGRRQSGSQAAPTGTQTQTYKHTDIQTLRHRERETQRHTETHRETQRHTETHRDTQRHTETHRDTGTHILEKLHVFLRMHQLTNYPT